MSDPIDRQAAIDALGEKPLARTKGEYEQGLQDQWERDVDALMELPSLQPGEDIRAICGECDAWNQYKNHPQPWWIPVVHGHWIRHDYADIVDGYLVPEFECSRCHSWKKDDSDYCPDCGARMNGAMKV